MPILLRLADSSVDESHRLWNLPESEPGIKSESKQILHSSNVPQRFTVQVRSCPPMGQNKPTAADEQHMPALQYPPMNLNVIWQNPTSSLSLISAESAVVGDVS